jgi:hypothetical protein
VQEDRNNPLPCTDEDRRKWGANGKGKANEEAAEQVGNPAGPDHEEQQIHDGDDVSDELLKDLMADPNAAPSGSAEAPKPPGDEPTKMP